MQVETIKWDDVQDQYTDLDEKLILAGELHDCASEKDVIELLTSQADPGTFDLAHLNKLTFSELKQLAREGLGIPNNIVV